MMAHSYLIRRYNVDSVAKKKIRDKTKRNKAVRTKDKERVHGFANYMDGFPEEVVELEKLTDHKKKLGGIVADMKSTNTITSAIENTRKVSSF